MKTISIDPFWNDFADRLVYEDDLDYLQIQIWRPICLFIRYEVHFVLKEKTIFTF